MRCRHPAPGLVLVVSLLAGCAAEPVPLPRPDERVADWWPQHPPGHAQVDVEVYTGEEDCDAYRGVEVTEYEDEVRILARVDAIGGPDCTGPETSQEVGVPLAEPVGERVLSGCVAPEEGLRHPDLDDHAEVDDCRDRGAPPAIGRAEPG